jgi:hypothetical protein
MLSLNGGSTSKYGLASQKWTSDSRKVLANKGLQFSTRQLIFKHEALKFAGDNGLQGGNLSGLPPSLLALAWV